MTLADMSLSEIRERIRAMTEARNKPDDISMGRGCDIVCVNCPCDNHNFKEFDDLKDKVCGQICQAFAQELMNRIDSGAVSQIEPQKCAVEHTAECRGCKHCKEVGGVLFCDIWHNTTVPEAFCCYHEATEPIIINDIPGIELDAVKVDGMSVDEWIAKHFSTGGFIDELPF